MNLQSDNLLVCVLSQELTMSRQRVMLVIKGTDMMHVHVHVRVRVHVCVHVYVLVCVGFLSITH